MASPEVNMQDISEVVIVTLPEPEDQRGEDLSSVVQEDKALLLANDTREEVLAPDEAEGSSAESLSKDDAVVVKLSEEVDVEAEVLYPITCADVKASLVWRKFVCPGINVKCVQFNQQLISPKEFVCLAGKSTLKDWKRAIRLNGTMLRKIMDSGDLDFYQHTQVCSNTCRSTKIDLVANKVCVGADPAADLLSSPASSTDLNGAALPESAEEPSEWVTAIGEDAVMFWRAVKEAGLLEEVVEDFQTELQVVFKRLQERVCEPPLQIKDAELLNSIVQNFGLLDLVKKVLAGHKSQMDRYREQYSRSLAALEQQCDEHRKQAKELKNKSQHLNNVLMTLAPPPPPPTKRPRLTRAVSGPAAVSPILAPAPSPTHMSLPLPQLQGLPLGKLMTVEGPGGGSRFTLLTSALSGPELAPNTSNLSVLSVAATQESGAGGIKVLGPQFQVVTLPTSSLHSASSLQSVVTALQANNIGSIDDLQEATLTDGGDGGQTDERQADGGDGSQIEERLADEGDGGQTDGGDGGQSDERLADGGHRVQTDGGDGCQIDERLADGGDGGQIDERPADGGDRGQTDGGETG